MKMVKGEIVKRRKNRRGKNWGKRDPKANKKVSCFPDFNKRGIGELKTGKNSKGKSVGGLEITIAVFL